MKLKIQFQKNTETGENEILGFECQRNNTASIRTLAENEVLIDASTVPLSFFSHWYEYVLEGTALVWSDRIVARNKQAALTEDAAKK